MSIFRTHVMGKLIGILCGMLAGFLMAQAQTFAFRHINRSDGLSQSNVTCIIQDHKGFMWFGTRDGLNKYDGYKITVYRNDPGNPRSLSHNYIRTLYEDRQHRLWIGSEDGGLSLYTPATDDFLNFLHNPGDTTSISSNKVRAIVQDSQNRLWVGTGGGGLNRFDAGKKTFSHYRHRPADIRSISGDDIEDIVEDAIGMLWIATWNTGLDKFNPAGNSFVHFRANKSDSRTLSSDKLKKLYIDADQTLWVGTTEGGLNGYNRETDAFTRYQQTPGSRQALSNNDVLSIAEDTQGNLWIGTQNGGINILDRNRKVFVHINEDVKNPDGLNNGSVYALYRDRQGNMWSGTFSGGVNLYTGTSQKFERITSTGKPDGLSNGNVLSIYQDPAGDLYIATDGGGLNIYSRRHKRFTSLLHQEGNKNSIASNYPLCLYEDSRRTLWVGCFYGKAAIFNKASHTFDNIPFSVDVKHVAAICEDTVTGKIWMGTWGEGVVVYDRQSKTWQQYKPEPDNSNSISHTVIFSLHQDRDGNMWVGTEGGGLNLYNRREDNFTRFEYRHQQNDGISNNIVNVIYEDRQGNLWIGTHGGLNAWHRGTGRFSTYTMKDGLANNVIQAIEEDQQGNLWLSTNNGISKFDPQKKIFRNYELAEGGQINAFNRLSSFSNQKGEIYFGGINGMNVFQPDSIPDSGLTPPVYFTELQVFNKSVDFREKDTPLSQSITEAKEIKLSYRQSVFSLEFVALDYTSPGKNQYAYKLEGFDENWNHVGPQRKATYTNLDPGEYTLRVKASNADGIWNTKGSSIRIIITPPFWQTGWARGIYLVILLAVFVVLRLVIVQRMRIRNRLEMDEMKLRFYANISHEFRTPLTLILGPLNHLAASAEIAPKDKQLLHLVHKNSRHLLKLINQLMHIYKLDAGFMKLDVRKGDIITFVKGIKETFQFMAAKRSIQYRFSTSVPYAEKYFDPDKLEKIVMNLISNAFKHTPDHGTIEVALSFIDNDAARVPTTIRKKGVASVICIAVMDSGEGISKIHHEKIFDPFFRIEKEHQSPEGTGIGLSLARQLARLHRGDILVESTVGKGSRFSAWLPVGPEAFDKNDVAAASPDLIYKRQDEQDSFEAAVPESLHQAGIKEASQKPVLLVVEDNPDIRGFIRLNFDSAFHIEEAVHGGEGFEKACSIVPDLILTDVMMPVMDGVAMCSKIKKDVRTSHIPVVLLTARSDEEFQVRAFKDAMADDYIVKPFHTNMLHAKLCNIIDMRENLKKKYYRDFITNPAAPPPVPSVDDNFIKQALAVVERYIDDPGFTLEKFCRELGMSQTNLYRKLQSLLGVSANQFIRDIRMKRALQLLGMEQYSVTEVAYKVGFADAKYFSKTFKKQFGVLPTAYGHPEKSPHRQF